MDITTITAALLGAPKQRNRLLRLHTTLGPNALVAESLKGIESVDEGGYRFDVTALSINAHIDLAELLDTPVLLQLLTAESRIDLRPFHGYITAIEHTGSNAGLARYRLIIEPWLSYLTQRTDSTVFQDMTVMAIAETVFAHYHNTGTVQSQVNTALTPAWHWDLANANDYRRRSITTQYNETDAHFIHRLLAEEGLFYWFEHNGELTSPTLGQHTLVIADHNSAFTPTDGPGQAIAYHRAATTETQDAIQQWHHYRHIRTATVAHASWNYRTGRVEPVVADNTQPDPIRVTDDDPAGPYAWHDCSEGQRRATQHLDASNLDSDTYSAQSSVRNLAPGQRFVLTEHADWAQLAADGTPNNQFICLSLHHHARNNLGADVESYIEQQLGKVQSAPTLPRAFQHTPDTQPQGSRDAVNTAHNNTTQTNRGPIDNGSATNPNDTGETDFYQNHLKAIAATTPYRPVTKDGYGQRRHPKPTVHGTQTAIVVGHNNQPIHTDRDHRVQIQYHWQRGSASASGQPHPSEHDNAAAQPAPTGDWVRVATYLVGNNYGSVHLPRVGQEVLVDFIEGDIDRPVIIASLYNGQGNKDAQHNQIPNGGSKATGNAAAWFAGNDHKAVYSGIKTQAMKTSQTGTGGYNQLRFDDTPNEAKLQLTTTQHHTGLHLGHLKAGQDNRRTHNRGYGIELTTEQSGALRAGSGLLITTEAAQNQMSATILQGVLNQARSLTTSLTATAQNQHTKLPQEPEPKELSAAQALEHTDQILSATETGTEPAIGIGGGDGEVPRFAEPMLAISGVDGIGMYTPKSQVWVAGAQTSLTAAQDISSLAQGHTTFAVAKGASLFTYGQAADTSRPVNETGIKLHAATGNVTLEATTGKAEFNAEAKATIASTNGSVTASAKKQFLATAGGAYLKLKGGNIELGAPGVIAFHAGQHVVTAPKSAQLVKAPLTVASMEDCEWKE